MSKLQNRLEALNEFNLNFEKYGECEGNFVYYNGANWTKVEVEENKIIIKNLPTLDSVVIYKSGVVNGKEIIEQLNKYQFKAKNNLEL